MSARCDTRTIVLEVFSHRSATDQVIAEESDSCARTASWEQAWFYVHPMTTNRPTNPKQLDLDALLAGTGLPEELTSAGGAIGRRLWPQLVEIRTQAGGRAVVMARLATDGGLLYQVDYGLRVCAERGLAVGTVIASIGHGLRAREKRPDLQLLDVILRRGDADTVWWRDVSRISRDTTFSTDWLDEMGQLSVGVIIDERLLDHESRAEQLLFLHRTIGAEERQQRVLRGRGRSSL